MKTRENAMKTCGWLVLCCGFVLMPDSSHAQRALSASQLNAVVRPSLKQCSLDKAQPASIIPTSLAKAFPQDRVEKTLHGVWRGRVSGAYPKQFLAKDGFLNVDYYWVIDMKRREALIVEQLSPKRSAPEVRRADAVPTFSFLMCGEEGYVPRHPRQIHEFEKVSDNIEDARPMLQGSTGLTAENLRGDFTLSAVWQQLVDTKYFDTSKFAAYAGGLFKPFEIGSVANAIGPAFLSMRYEAEYRGSGATAAQFTPATPIRGVEEAQFVGVTTNGRDYLVASFGNGKVWRKEATQGGVMELAFDKVVIGPLAQ